MGRHAYRETIGSGTERKVYGTRKSKREKEVERERRERERGREIDGGREYGQSLPRRRGGPVINIPYPLCLGLPLRRGTGAPYLVETLLPTTHTHALPPPFRENPGETPLAPSS